MQGCWASMLSGQTGCRPTKGTERLWNPRQVSLCTGVRLRELERGAGAGQCMGEGQGDDGEGSGEMMGRSQEMMGRSQER